MVSISLLFLFLFLSCYIRTKAGDSCSSTASCDEKSECAGSEYCDDDCKRMQKGIINMDVESTQFWAVRHRSLANLFIMLDCKVVAEIGIAYGGLTKFLLTKVDSIKEYHGVDPFLGGYDKNDAMSKWLEGRNAREQADAVLEKLKMFGCRFHLHIGTSSDVVKTFKNESIDCLFIDGLHTYNGVVQDIKNWLPIMKRGGNFIYDDYSHSFQGLVLAVDQFTDNNELEIIKVNDYNNYYTPLHQNPYKYNLSFEAFFDYGHPGDKLV